MIFDNTFFLRREGVFMDRRTLIFVIAFLVMGAAATSGAQKRYDVPIGDSPQRGPANAPVTIVEFLDYQ
jgi:hypothetical protein